MNNEKGTIKMNIEVDSSQLDEAIAKTEKLIAITKEYNQLVKGKKPYKPKGHEIIEAMQNDDDFAICFEDELDKNIIEKQKHFLKWVEENYPYIRWVNLREKPTKFIPSECTSFYIIDKNYLCEDFYPEESIEFEYKDFPLKRRTRNATKSRRKT